MILNSLFRPFYWITITCYTKTVTLKVYFYCFCCNSLVLWLLLYHFYLMFYISIHLADSLKSFLVYFSTVTFIVSIVISYQFSSNVNPEHCIYSHSKRFPDYAPKCFCKWFLLKNHRAKKGLESLKKEKKTLLSGVFHLSGSKWKKKPVKKRKKWAALPEMFLMVLALLWAQPWGFFQLRSHPLSYSWRCSVIVVIQLDYSI